MTLAFITFVIYKKKKTHLQRNPIQCTRNQSINGHMTDKLFEFDFIWRSRRSTVAWIQTFAPCCRAWATASKTSALLVSVSRFKSFFVCNIVFVMSCGYGKTYWADSKTAQTFENTNLCIRLNTKQRILLWNATLNFRSLYFNIKKKLEQNLNTVSSFTYLTCCYCRNLMPVKLDGFITKKS